MTEVLYAGSPARIFFKTGKQQMGLLLNDVEQPEPFDDGVKFIPHEKLSEWFESYSHDCITIVEPELVDGIDLLMK
ncbi:MAG: hypothetical protein HY064_01395 [Bacteroidetes bacterium]|nr:hypothetical protein [Bacteroidota bacterium]